MAVYFVFYVLCICAGLYICFILPSRTGEHGVSWENLENIEKNMEQEQMTQNSIIHDSLFATQNTLIVNQMTQNIKFYVIHGDG